MRLGKYLVSLTKSELESVKGELNLSDDELLVFECLARGKSIVATSEQCKMATSTVSNKVKDIVAKLKRL